MNGFAAELDRLALLGNGGSDGIRGVKSLADSSTAVASIGALADFSDVLTAWLNIANNNAEANAIVMAPREFKTFAGLQDTTNQPMQRPGLLDSLQWHYTSAIPVNEGGGSNESSMYLGDFRRVIIGVRQEMVVSVSGDEGFSKFQRKVRLTWRGDVNVEHAKHFSVLSGITP